MMNYRRWSQALGAMVLLLTFVLTDVDKAASYFGDEETFRRNIFSRGVPAQFIGKWFATGDTNGTRSNVVYQFYPGGNYKKTLQVRRFTTVLLFCREIGKVSVQGSILTLTSERRECPTNTPTVQELTWKIEQVSYGEHLYLDNILFGRCGEDGPCWGEIPGR